MLIALKCSHLLFAMITITVKCSISAASQCPEAYWDEPSKACSSHLVHHLQHGDSFKSYKINKTCIAWEMTKSCYNDLMNQCRMDKTAVDVVKSHLDRYHVFSSPCASRYPRSESLAELEPLTSCFLTYFLHIQTCTEVFDSKFRQFVREKDFSHACRIITSAMRCFFDTMHNKIGPLCGEDGAEEFRQTYIEPVVQQSRDTVISKCILPPALAPVYFPPESSSTRNQPHLVFLPFFLHMIRFLTTSTR